MPLFREMKHHKIEPKLGEREKEARASCCVRVPCICWCPVCPTSLRKGKKQKPEVAFARSENLEWIPLLCVDGEMFLFNDPCPTSWRICRSNLVAVKPSLSHPWAPGVPLVLGSAPVPMREGSLEAQVTARSLIPVEKSVREERPFSVPLGSPLEAGGTRISDPCSCERDTG